jgi:hypothetical protein
MREEMSRITDGMGRLSHFDGWSKKWCDPILDPKHYLTDIWSDKTVTTKN